MPSESSSDEDLNDNLLEASNTNGLNRTSLMIDDDLSGDDEEEDEDYDESDLEDEEDEDSDGGDGVSNYMIKSNDDSVSKFGKLS